VNHSFADTFLISTSVSLSSLFLSIGLFVLTCGQPSRRSLPFSPFLKKLEQKKTHTFVHTGLMPLFPPPPLPLSGLGVRAYVCGCRNRHRKAALGFASATRACCARTDRRSASHTLVTNAFSSDLPLSFLRYISISVVHFLLSFLSFCVPTSWVLSIRVVVLTAPWGRGPMRSKYCAKKSWSVRLSPNSCGQDGANMTLQWFTKVLEHLALILGSITPQDTSYTSNIQT
jgi:hypothetical protein